MTIAQHAPAASSARLPRLVRPHRQPHDTEAGCRARAALQLQEAAAMGTDHARRRMEHSAASWTARADLLCRLDAGMTQRRGTASAE